MIAHFSAAPFIVVSQTGRPLRRVFFLFLKHTVFTAVDEVDQPARIVQPENSISVCGDNSKKMNAQQRKPKGAMMWTAGQRNPRG